MTGPAPSYGWITELLAGYGLMPRGGFHPVPEDEVPGGAATLVLVGNAGPAMWREFANMPFDLPDALDHWSRCAIDAVAANLGATALYPFGAPPFLPFQRWAQKAEPVYPSPLGVLIHPDYGLWHAYRGALAFAGRLDLPPRREAAKPCDSCAGRPCLATCPVGAFDGKRYDVPACVAHLRPPAGDDCVTLGCRARRACPVGVEHAYRPKQAAFHMRAFLRAQETTHH